MGAQGTQVRVAVQDHVGATGRQRCPLRLPDDAENLVRCSRAVIDSQGRGIRIGKAQARLVDRHVRAIDRQGARRLDIQIIGETKAVRETEKSRTATCSLRRLASIIRVGVNAPRFIEVAVNNAGGIIPIGRAVVILAAGTGAAAANR